MNTTSLQTVPAREAGDALIVAECPPGVKVPMPLQSGEEGESLACGGCGWVMFQGVSTKTTWEQFAVRKRLLAQCLCGAFNIVPAHRVVTGNGLATPDTRGLALPGLGGALLVVDRPG